MNGVVTGRDVILNLRTIWVEFGPGVTLSCLGAILKRKPTTFLDLALKDVVFSPARPRKRSR